MHPRKISGTLSRNSFFALMVLTILGCSESSFEYDYLTLAKMEASNPKESARLCRKGVAKGNADAQALLGIMMACDPNEYVPLDLEQGIALLEESVAQGNAFAQGHLGMLCSNGVFPPSGPNFPRDPDRAYELLKLSAEQDNAAGQAFLGAMLCIGDDVPRDLIKGVELLEQAANKGHPHAQCYLALLYLGGTGVEKNEAKAMHLMQQSAQQGFPDAVKALSMLQYAENAKQQAMKQSITQQRQYPRNICPRCGGSGRYQSQNSFGPAEICTQCSGRGYIEVGKNPYGY